MSSNNKVSSLKKVKTQMNYIQANSLRDLLLKVNSYNMEHPDSLILKDDIVEIMESEGTFVLLYYK